MRLGFFYGWVIVGASFTILTVAYGVQFSYGVFLPHMMADLGLDRVALTAPFSLFVLVYTVMGFVSGPATDRFGPRTVVLAGAALLALGYGLLATVVNEWQLYLFLSLITGIGMSAVFVPVNATVVRWFMRRRGLALAISGTGVNAALLFGPMLAALIIPLYGWRSALVLLAFAAVALIVVCGLTLVRNPELHGTLPDGRGQEDDTNITTDEVSWTAREAAGTAAFWVISGVYVLTWIMLFFPFVHLPIMAAELGYDATSGASLVTAMGAGGIIGRVLFGWVSDHIGRLRTLYLALAVEVVAFLLFAQFQSLIYLYFAAALFIAASSSATSLYPAVIADIFGRGHIGAVTGLSFSIAGAAAAVGPLLAGVIRDQSGSYQAAFYIGAALNAAAIALLLTLRQPRRRQAGLGEIGRQR